MGMSGESWAEYVKEKNARAVMDDTKETAFKYAQEAIRMGIDVDTLVGMVKAGGGVAMAGHGVAPSTAAAAMFLMESWIREEYERAGKG